MSELPLNLPRDLYDQLRRHGEATYPHECCGILLGASTAIARIVVRTIPTRNASGSPANRYEIAASDLIRTLSQARSARAGGERLEIVGFYHSHPDHPPEPSATDLAEAHWLSCSYIITSVIEGDATDTRSFHLAGSREEDKHFQSEGLQIIEHPSPTQSAPSNADNPG